MKKNLIFILVLIIIIAILYFLYSFFGGSQEEGITPPEATGNVEDVEDALLQELTDMENIFLEEDASADLILSDDSILDDFGQSINENDL